MRATSIALLFFLACKPSEEGPPTYDAIDGVQVQMDFARTGFWDAPFPSDDLGVPPDLSGFPNPDGVAIVDEILAMLASTPAFSTTSGVFFQLDGPVDVSGLDALASIADSPVYLVPLTGPRVGIRHPVTVDYRASSGPFGTEHHLSLLPVQGIPLIGGTRYAAVVRRDLNDATGTPLGVSESMAGILSGDVEVAGSPYVDAVSLMEALGMNREEIAGLAVFTTQSPALELTTFVDHARGQTLEPTTPVLTDVFEEYCVYEGTVDMPDYQAGDPPFETEGGGWTTDAIGNPEIQRWATSRYWVTVPRTPMSEYGWPLATFIRTGGGGDNPLVDRGLRDETGTAEPGTGPALQLARAGWAGFSIDGPHGGARNPESADEQFLMFNVANLTATRDNVRQSALELALLPDLQFALEFDTTDCPDSDASFVVDPEFLALIGHSMGATIAPLTLAAETRFDLAVLSGAGGSYIHNLVWKESPIAVRPVAESMLGYDAAGVSLHPHDPVLSLLQWAAESADPPSYASSVPLETRVLMVQGIVDTYIFPPMANAVSLSLGLDLGGPPLDETHPDLTAFTPLSALQPLVGTTEVPLPIAAGKGVVVQHAEDGLEDGHEVLFQVEAATRQFRCLLASSLTGQATVVESGALDDPCP